MDDSLTGLEHLLLVGRRLRMDPDDARARAGCLLLQFDLSELAARPVRDYPAESLDRLTVAAALMDAPELPPADAWTLHVRPADPADGPLVTAILTDLLPLMADQLRAWDISIKELRLEPP
ncbi:hypothetical protein WEI85_12400 [Actinomycetes bacterium KLBMP 9797]